MPMTYDELEERYSFNEPDEYSGWTFEQKQAELNRLKGKFKGGDRQWALADVRQGVGDVLAARLTGHMPADVHPFARGLQRDGANPSFVDLMKVLSIAHYGEEARGWNVEKIYSLAGYPATDDFGNLFGEVANSLVLRRQPKLLATALKITRAIELANFNQSNIGTVSLKTPIEPATVYGGGLTPWQTMQPSGIAESMALRSSAVRVLFSEQFIWNDDINAIQNTIDATTTCAAQNEMTSLFTLLNSDVALSDGGNAFDAAYGNAVGSLSKDASGLNSAIALLRAQTQNTQKADCAPRYLVVPAADEMTARKLVRDAYGDTGEVETIPTAYLDAYWFLLSDPEIWPIFLRATMRGQRGVSLGLSRGFPTEKEGSRDLVLQGGHSYDYAIASRTGAVRMAFS